MMTSRGEGVACGWGSKGPRVMETVQGLVHRGHMVEVRGRPVMQARLRGNPVGQPKKGRIKVFKGLSPLSDAEVCYFLYKKDHIVRKRAKQCNYSVTCRKVLENKFIMSRK
jgi:hypothetical protein